MDIVPTISEMIGIPLLDIYDGHSLKNKNWPGHEKLVWSNSLDFNNNLFSVRIFDEPYIFWQDDFNFSTPRIFKIKDEGFEIIDEQEIINKYKNQAFEHIDFIRTKQLKYRSSQNNEKREIKEELDKDVLDALKSLGYM